MNIGLPSHNNVIHIGDRVSQDDKNLCTDTLFKNPFEKLFNRTLTPFEEFVHDEASSGLLLMACAVIAMVMANTFLFQSYNSILHLEITIGAGSAVITHTLHHWINDGLMTLFFFTVGLEIKREILIGELADKKQAILPISAAIGGMVVPALLYIFFAGSDETRGGWGIPMATDIAFALGVLALLGKRIPKALIGFLLALAIVDDLGAVVVIALFYTEQIHLGALLFAGVAFIFLILSNLAGIRRPLPYVVFGLLLWLGMLKSGIHATLAGVITAVTVPANSHCLGLPFVERMDNLVGRFRKVHDPGQNIMENSTQQSLLQSMENCVHKMESPLQRMEHSLHIWVAFLIIPLFALANAGIPIDFKSLGETISHPVTIGVAMGLVFGKGIGVFAFSYLVLKMGWSRLPEGVKMSQIAGVALLSGIGFTMSIFIGSLAFAHQEDYLLNAKIGIIGASIVAGLAGYIWLLLVSKKV